MNDPDNKINLKGLAVGNGCWGSKVGLCSFGSDAERIYTQFLYGHGACPAALYEEIIEACGDPMKGPMTWPETLPPACAKAVQTMHAGTGSFEVCLSPPHVNMLSVAHACVLV